MQPEDEINKNGISSLGLRSLLFVCLLGLLFVFLFYYSRTDNGKDVYTQALNRGVELLRQGDTESESINNLKQAIGFAKTPNEKAAAEWQLGLAYSLKGDHQNSADVLKKIVTDTSYPSTYRSGALIRMLGSTYQRTKNRTAAEQYIFSGAEPWSGFLENGDVELAVRKAYEWSVELADLAASPHYYIAMWYADQLYEDSSYKHRETLPVRDEYTARIGDNLDKGDMLLPAVLAAISVEEWEKIFASNSRGNAYAEMFFSSRDPADREAAETSFKQSIAMFADGEGLSEYSNAYKAAAEAYTYYDYARFLAYLTVEKIADRTDEVVAYSDKIAALRGSTHGLLATLQHVNQFPDNELVAMKRTTRMVADLNSNFESLLREVGWQ